MLIVIASSMMFNYLVSLRNFQNNQVSMLSQIASKISANVWFVPDGSSIVLHPDRHMGVMSIMIYDSSRVYYMNTGSSPIAYASPSNPLNLSTIVPQTYIQIVMQGNTYLAVLMDNGVLYTYRHNNLGSGSDGASATYYLDAVAGYYYVISTGKNLAAYYLDSNGNRVSIPTYRWDINHNWVIFQAPATTRIYLTTTNTPLSTFTTPSSWFPEAAIVPPAPYYTVTIRYPSPWSQTKTYTVSPFTPQIRSIILFDGANILVVNEYVYKATNAVLEDSSFISGTVTRSRCRIDYVEYHQFTVNVNIQSFNSAPSANIYVDPRGWYISPYNEIRQNYWLAYDTTTYGTLYFLDGLSYTGGGSMNSASATITLSCDYGRTIVSQSYTSGRSVYYVYITIVPISDVRYLYIKPYNQVNRVITTATGVNIYVVGSLDSLPTV
jgi:hypothetical protein